MFSYSHDFLIATELLRNTIKLEVENIDYFEHKLLGTQQKATSKGAPILINKTTLKEYQEMKLEYKQIVSKLLHMRTRFSQKLIKDILPTLTTHQDDFSEAEVSIEQYVEPVLSKQASTKIKGIELRKDYVCKLFVLFILTVISAVILGVIVLFTKYYELVGFLLVCSKSGASGILTSVSFLLLFMSHDLMTLIRRHGKGRLTHWFDHYYIFHQFGGYLMTVYAVIHTICHLTGSIRVISSTEDLNEVNSHLSDK